LSVRAAITAASSTILLLIVAWPLAIVSWMLRLMTWGVGVLVDWLTFGPARRRRR
jgi:hypothetical protein